MSRIRRVFVVVFVPLSLVVGCVDENDRTSPEIVGLTFEQADPYLPEDATYLIQDVSVIFDREPSYNPYFFGSPNWMIVGACSDERVLHRSRSIEIAIVPTDALLGSPAPVPGDSRFANAVTCEGRPY